MQKHVRDHLKDFVAIAPRRNIKGRFPRPDGLWRQRFYVDPRTGLLCRTADLPEEKARRRLMRQRPAPTVECIALSSERAYRLLNGHWFEIHLAPMPTPVYRASREAVQRPLVAWRRNSRMFEADMEVRRLTSPPVFDVVTKSFIAVGPAIDTPDQWKIYRRAQPRTTYAFAKRTLSRKELQKMECHG